MRIGNRLHLLVRKIRAFGLTVRRCKNWIAVSLARRGLRGLNGPLRLRSGLELHMLAPLHDSWGVVFEPAIADVYGVRTSDADLIVDVGGHIGAFACLAAALHPNARVHVFEPSPEHVEAIALNTRSNELGNVTIHQIPVTRDGRRVEFVARVGGGSSGILPCLEGERVSMGSTTLDRVELADARSLLLKLDCEGAEGEILQWVVEHLDALPARTAIACEYHPWCPVPRERSDFTLRAAGFEVETRILFDETYLFARRETAG